jgi:hypothetical protein
VVTVLPAPAGLADAALPRDVVDGWHPTVHNAEVPLRPRPLVRAMVVVLALSAGACSDDPSSSPSSTEPPSTTTTGSVPTDAASAAVLDAYAASWDAFSDFVNGEPPGAPSDYFDGVHLANVLERIAEYAEEGLELRGEADLDPHDVEVTGSVASLVDCQVDGTYAVERSTGEIVIPATARPQEVLVDLVRVDGRWKVSRVEYAAEGSCVR